MADHEEFDKEDEHEHTEECGHTPADHERMERLNTNMKKFLAENAEDMLETGMYEKLKNKIEKRLRAAGINPSLTTLKIFREGFEFGMFASQNVSNHVGPILAGINKMVLDKEKKSPIPKIDITKSVPMPPKEDGPAKQE